MYRGILILAISMVFLAFKSDKNAYMIFDVKGKECHYAKMLEGTLDVEIKGGQICTFKKGDAILEVMNT